MKILMIGAVLLLLIVMLIAGTAMACNVFGISCFLPLALL